METFQRTLSKTHLAVSLAPWLNLLVFTAYALAARFTLGHFPQNLGEFSPQSSLVAFDFDLLVSVTVGWLVLCVPLWMGITLWRIVRWKDWGVWRAAVVFGLGWAAMLLVDTVDPVGFMKWFYP